MTPLASISDFWSPLAYAIMFGLSFAMILTLVLVPTLFYRAEKKKLQRELIFNQSILKQFSSMHLAYMPRLHGL